MKRLLMADFHYTIIKSGLQLSSHIDTFSIPFTFRLFDPIHTNLYIELRTQL